MTYPPTRVIVCCLFTLLKLPCPSSTFHRNSTFFFVTTEKHDKNSFGNKERRKKTSSTSGKSEFVVAGPSTLIVTLNPKTISNEPSSYHVVFSDSNFKFYGRETFVGRRAKLSFELKIASPAISLVDECV